MSTLTIGAVAKAAGVGVETIRFYEREGPGEISGRRGGWRSLDLGPWNRDREPIGL